MENPLSLEDGILHTCGGDPIFLSTLVKCTGVFSTHVEVILFYEVLKLWFQCILHTCGGDPQSKSSFVDTCKYSPHMWR